MITANMGRNAGKSHKREKEANIVSIKKQPPWAPEHEPMANSSLLYAVAVGPQCTEWSLRPRTAGSMGALQNMMGVGDTGNILCPQLGK